MEVRKNIGAICFVIALIMLPLAFYRETLHYKLTLTATLPEPVGARQFSLEGRRALLATYDNQPGIIPELFRRGYAWTPVVMLATAILLPLIALTGLKIRSTSNPVTSYFYIGSFSAVSTPIFASKF